MEIRNNTPSFGMALRKPQDIEKFTKYIVSGGPECLAKRGLSRVVKQQAGNAHFDLEYRPGQGVAVIPTSEAAQKYGHTEEIFGKGSKVSDVRSNYIRKYTGEAYEKAYEAASKPKRVLMTTKKVFALIRTLGSSVIRPEQMLPTSMRAASNKATIREGLVERRIAEDAAALAKKQKLEASIESIFTPKASKKK